VSRRLVVGAQAAYFLVTGSWAVVHRRSFEAVTGPKVDYWLVRLVGGLAAAIGAALAAGAARRREPAAETVVLAAASAAAFGAADAVYAGSGRIRRVYLLDLAAEAALLAGLTASGRRGPGRR
jgi:hypothetical protein